MSRTALLEDPELRPFLPLLLVAWSDGDLERDDRVALRAHVARMPWLRPAARIALEAWLEPDAPPSFAEMKALRDALKNVAATLAPDRRRDLVALGSSMAGPNPNQETLAAIEELARELGGDEEPLSSLVPPATSTSSSASGARAHDGAPGHAAPGHAARGHATSESAPGGAATTVTTPTRAAHVGAETTAPNEGGLASPRAAPPGPPARIDVASVRRFLDGAHAKTRDRARAFVADPERRAYGLPLPEYREKVMGWLAALAKEGFGRLAYPGITTEEHDLGAFFATFETLAMGDLSLVVKLGVQFGLFGGSVYFLGTGAQRKKYLPAASALELLGCFAMSEVGHGSDVQSLETEARWDPNARTFTIVTPAESARKDWIGGAAATARVATVFAELVAEGDRHGVHAFVVPIRDADGKTLDGVRASDCGHKMGLNGVDNGRLWFDHVVVPEDALLARFAWMAKDGSYESAIGNPKQRFFTMLGTLVGGRISVASAAITASKVALTIATRYAMARRQFGPSREEELPLLAYPTHQRRLLPRLATTFVLSIATRALQERFAEAQRTGDDGVPKDTREIESSAAVLKALTTTHAVETIAECRRACGGQGYLSVNRFAALADDVEIFTTFEGDNTVLLQLVAKSLLAGFKKRFESGGLSGVVRQIMKKAEVAAKEKNVVAVRRASAEHLRDRDFHLAAFRYREERLLETAAARLRKRLGAKMDPQTAMLEVQEHLVALAWAHADRIALEAFDAALARAATTQSLGDAERETLERLGALYALGRIRAEASFYFGEGYIDPTKESAMRKETARLLREITPDAVALTASFGIPDTCLAAPIAFMDPAHPRW